MSQAVKPSSAQTSLETRAFFKLAQLTSTAPHYIGPRKGTHEENQHFLYILFLFFFPLCFVLFIYRNSLNSSVSILRKHLVFAEHLCESKHRQAVTWAHIIADNLLLCIAFSTDGSTVYQMFQQEHSPLCCSFLGTIWQRKTTADDGSAFVWLCSKCPDFHASVNLVWRMFS